MFTNLTGLLELSVKNNPMTQLDRESFSGLNQLVSLDLSNNLITSLPQEIFDNATQLRYLILRRNRLTHISLKVFVKLSYLRKLDLSHNSLLSVSTDGISTSSINLAEIRDIDLSRNNLTDFPAWLLLRPYLSIDLSGNSFAFQAIKLALQKTANTSFGYILGIPYLHPKTLYLRQNAFTEFDIGKLDSVSLVQFKFLVLYFRLDFGDEIFNCDCSMYFLYQYLRNINTRNLIGNQRSTFEYNKKGFNCLRPIELRGQPLMQAHINALGCYESLPTCPKHCRCWVKSIDRAVKVNCSYQNLTQLPNSIPDRSIKLDFSHNKLANVQHVFPNYLPSLQVLDLSNNDLEYIDGSMFEAQLNISDLLLHDNKLMILPE